MAFYNFRCGRLSVRVHPLRGDGGTVTREEVYSFMHNFCFEIVLDPIVPGVAPHARADFVFDVEAVPVGAPLWHRGAGVIHATVPGNGGLGGGPPEVVDLVSPSAVTESSSSSGSEEWSSVSEWDPTTTASPSYSPVTVPIMTPPVVAPASPSPRDVRVGGVGRGCPPRRPPQRPRRCLCGRNRGGLAGEY